MRTNHCKIVATFICVFLQSSNILTQASICNHPPVPLGASFDQSWDLENTTTQVRFFCSPGFYLLGNDVINCEVESNRWLGDIPVCASDVVKNKPTFQSSLTSLSSKPILPASTHITKHEGKYCSQTSLDDKSPWWKVDLISATSIVAINVTFAMDTPMLKSVEVRVGNNSNHQDNPLCTWISAKSRFESTSFILTRCDGQSWGRFLSFSAFNSGGNPLTICNVKVLSTQVQNDLACQPDPGNPDLDSGSFLLNNKCYIRGHEAKLGFNESQEFCSKFGLDLLSNRNSNSYNLLIGLENEEKSGRKVIWLGARMSPVDGQWYWVDERKNFSSNEIDHEQLKMNSNNHSEVRHFLWGLLEPSGEDCVVVDSALKWMWNSLRCVISANVICEGQIKFCPLPNINQGSHILDDTGKQFYSVGNEIFYQCAQGYKLIGPLVRQCQDDGWWSAKAPECIYYDCGPYPESEGVFVTYSGDNKTTYGASASLSCNSGYLPSKKEVKFLSDFEVLGSNLSIQCEENSWSGGHFECIAFTCGLEEKDSNLSLMLVTTNETIFARNFSCKQHQQNNFLPFSFSQCSNSIWSPPLPNCSDEEIEETTTNDVTNAYNDVTNRYNDAKDSEVFDTTLEAFEPQTKTDSGLRETTTAIKTTTSGTSTTSATSTQRPAFKTISLKNHSNSVYTDVFIVFCCFFTLFVESKGPMGTIHK